MTELSWFEVIARLGAAALLGGALGLNRFLHHKNIGVRTLGLVAVTAAGLVAGTVDVAGSDAASRAIQGIITGIGFIGAGVIVRAKDDHGVRGLTTAATVWVSAGIGTLCGLGSWRILTVAAVLIGLMLLDGGRFEKWIVHVTRPKPPPGD